MDKPIWTRPLSELFQQFKSDPDQGLTQDQADLGLTKEGENLLPRKGKITLWKLLFEQFSSFIIWLLIGAAIVAGALGEVIDAWAIVAIVILNAALGFFQEFRAERSLEALQKMAAPLSKVIREGILKRIPSKELVPGDLILLEAGDRVPADGRIVDLAYLNVDEASLTGESLPIAKTADTLHGDLPLGDQTNRVFMGTTIASGKGHVLITATGLNTEMGKIAAGIMDHKREVTPLQRKLDQLGKKLVFVCLIIVVIVFCLGILRGSNLIEMLLVALSLAVAAIPEGLPAAVTISLSIGVRKMADKKALVRRLSSVETLGSTNVICTDKTGTLTQNAMTVQQVFVDNCFVKVTGVGYEPEGTFDVQTEGLTRALSIATLCNNANIFQENETWHCAGDPTEGALLTAAGKLGLKKADLEKESPLLKEIPFDSDRKMMSVLRKQGDSKILYVKGAPDVLFKRAKMMLLRGKEVPIDLELFESANYDLTSQAYRVLAVAYQSDQTAPLEENLILVGLIAMIDPPREEVKKALQDCKNAGIRTIMVTGDHKQTAIAIAKELGMNEGESIDGKELDHLSDDQLDKVTVFSRISASHKLRIVKALQEKGQVTAMTGDGVNDAPAVIAADIGISMGITGTDVTKECSDMIILDDNFASIVQAVKQGRGIYDNIVKFVSYLLSSNIAEILVIFIAMVIGLKGPKGALFIPLLPVQLLWMNLVTDGFPAIALAMDPIDPRAMTKPPRPSSQQILNGRFSLFIVSISLLVTAGALVACLYGLKVSVAKAQTMTFTTLIVLELIRAQMIRKQYQLSLFSNPYLLWALLSSFFLQLLVVYIPSLQPIFGTVFLDLKAWIVIFGIAFTLWWAGLAVTKLFYK